MKMCVCVCETHLHTKHFASRFDSTVFESELVLPDDCPAVFVSGVSHHVKIWSPHFKFPFPIDDGGEGGTNQEGSLGVTLKERNSNKANQF